jgi:polyisoprenoid-binding protein YceI
VSTSVETRAEAGQTLPNGTWNVDPVHSHTGFAVEYVVGTFRGSFSPIEGKLEVTDDGQAILSGSAPVAGVKVQDENLAAHLQSPEFFDLERTPKITFRSTAIERAGEQLAIRGDLTIKGVVLPIEATGTITEPTEDAHGGVRFGLELVTTIDRTKFGIEWNDDLPNGKPALADEVQLSAELILVRA